MSREKMAEKDKSQLNKNTSTRPEIYVSGVLKAQFGNSEDFLAFERYFYYQTEELNVLRATEEHLLRTVSKLQEDKRSLEMQLLSERVARDQEAKNSKMEIEKINVQQNAQIYTSKCEADSWKRKAEAIFTECSLLKKQMKTVEVEKNHSIQKLAELNSNLNEFERCRQSFESYSRRQRQLIQMTNKKLSDLEKARESLDQITESNQKQVNTMKSQLSSWGEERAKSAVKISELEKELLQKKTELVSNNAKLTRFEMTERQTTNLVDKLVEQNKDLQKGLSILMQSMANQIDEADQQLLQKTILLQQQIDTSVKRLSLKESDFSPHFPV